MEEGKRGEKRGEEGGRGGRGGKRGEEGGGNSKKAREKGGRVTDGGGRRLIGCRNALCSL